MHPIVILFWVICLANWGAWLGLAFKSDVRKSTRNGILIVALVATFISAYATLLNSLPMNN